MTGPLVGYRIVELAGIGPGPFAGMMLADMGAEVVRVERGPTAGSRRSRAPADVLARGRRSVAVDLKHPDGPAVVLDLVERADALIEGFRPGVTERLGVGPQVCLERNPRLVYGRMTGWGQEGPLAHAAGHDINYISLAGALAHFGRRGEGPVPPMNMVGDFGGGGMLLAFGIVCALLETQRSGRGQVIDAAMIDGTALLMAMFWSLKAMGLFDENQRGGNSLDTGAHFYDVYRCADGEYVSIGAIEPPFYAELLKLTGLAADDGFTDQHDASEWPRLTERLADVIATRTRAEWTELMEGTDVCFAPVLRMTEATQHPHNRARSVFIERDGIVQPAPAPRFSRTAAEVQRSAPHAGQHSREVLADWGVAAERIDELVVGGAVVDASA